MKKSIPSPKYNIKAETKRGVALVMTLAFIGLMTGLLLAFIAATRSDIRASASYVRGTNARLVANSALNLVLAQLQKSTAYP